MPKILKNPQKNTKAQRINTFSVQKFNQLKYLTTSHEVHWYLGKCEQEEEEKFQEKNLFSKLS